MAYMAYRDERITVLFGDRRYATHVPLKQLLPRSTAIDARAFLVSQECIVDDIVLLRQIHGVDGYVINTQDEISSLYGCNGDFMITALPGVAIGSLTADCLPVVITDRARSAVSVIHAGWRGAVEGIVIRALRRFCDEFNVKSEDVRVFFGPSAHVCCYEVSHRFLEERYGIDVDISPSMTYRDHKQFFDLPLYVTRQLNRAGIASYHIDRSYALCTICVSSFCSYRRNQASDERQFTFAVLHHKNSVM